MGVSAALSRGADSDSLESLRVLFSRSWGGRAWLSVVLARLGALEPRRIPDF